MEIRERSSISYNNPPQSKQESSPRLSSTPLISSPTSKTIRNEVLGHPHLHHKNHIHGFQLQEKLKEQRPRKDPNPDPDPPQPISQTPSQPPPPPPPLPSATAVAVVRYRECLKNHAATMGAHVVDGCGEFMPSGEGDTPEALQCAACECHRSFHRREADGESQSGHYAPPNMTIRLPSAHNPPPRAAAVQLPHHRYHHPTPSFMMAFGGAAAESSSEDLNVFRTNARVHMMTQTSKKRFRTKFTQEQKEKMQDFAERIGWKIQKQDEQEVLQFCSEFGIKRQVFKVWMHNNKQATKKKL